MKIADDLPKVFVITFPNQTRKCVENIYTYEVDRGILYLKNENGEVQAAFKKWWSFEIK
jgi:hypothetical protein